jgi:hypothetical protein
MKKKTEKTDTIMLRLCGRELIDNAFRLGMNPLPMLRKKFGSLSWKFLSTPEMCSWLRSVDYNSYYNNGIDMAYKPIPGVPEEISLANHRAELAETLTQLATGVEVLVFTADRQGFVIVTPRNLRPSKLIPSHNTNRK